jgi:hypothetical protein
MKIHLMFHVSLLEPYHAFTNPRRIHDPPIEVDGEQEYEVDSRIQGFIIVKSNILFISMGMM